MKRKIIFFLLSITIINFIFFSFFTILDLSESYGVSKYGSSGEEVKQIQEKLKRWGYYKGEIDGIYGSKTVAAVKEFQKKNNLKVDGIAGEQTLKAIGITASNNNSTSYKNVDKNLLSKVIYSESRGEPYKGQVAVGAVVLNRVASSKFPNSVAGVVYQSGAFDAVADGQINLTPDNQAKKAAEDAINGWDPTSGCIYYFNPNTATSSWIWSRPQVLTIGKHIFCK